MVVVRSKKTDTTKRTIKKTGLALPTEKSTPVKSIWDYAIYLYGPVGIGKTSFISQFPNTLFFFYEPSGDALELYQLEPKSWKDFLTYISMLEKEHEAGTLQYKTAVIDVVDLCYMQALRHICEPMDYDWPPEDYGKTWNRIKDEFRRAIYRLKAVMGVVFISHSQEKKIKRLNGIEYDTIVPTMIDNGSQIVSKFCGIQACYMMTTRETRILMIEPNNKCEVKNRVKNHFLYTNGNKIHNIPMGTSEEVSYKNFINAYNNKLIAPVVKQNRERSIKRTIKRRSNNG